MYETLQSLLSAISRETDSEEERNSSTQDLNRWEAASSMSHVPSHQGQS